MCENVKLVICRVMFYCLESWPGKFAFLSHVSMMVSQNSCYAVAGEVFLFQFAFSVISVVFTVFQLYDCIMGLHLCFKQPVRLIVNDRKFSARTVFFSHTKPANSNNPRSYTIVSAPAQILHKRRNLYEKKKWIELSNGLIP